MPVAFFLHGAPLAERAAERMAEVVSSGMGTLGISHVAIGVSDMDRALEFYRDLIGLRVTLDTVEGIADRGGEIRRRRAVYLRANDGPNEFFIVLDQQLDRPPFGNPPRLFQLGTHHFSFWVDNIDEVVARADAAGFPLLVAPMSTKPAAYGETDDAQPVITAILKDGDGNPVQLDQRAW
jgi:catechol 2,3-dioxygenase-like lactoylglutathione lyase family enzyme